MAESQACRDKLLDFPDKAGTAADLTVAEAAGGADPEAVVLEVAEAVVGADPEAEAVDAVDAAVKDQMACRGD